MKCSRCEDHSCPWDACGSHGDEEQVSVDEQVEQESRDRGCCVRSCAPAVGHLRT
jgi:hypothetical protein